MKTFVADDYQISLNDNGGFAVQITRCFCDDSITYNPDLKKPWTHWYRRDTFRISQSLSGLWLSKSMLEILHKALEAVGKQDLMDKEIVFVDKKL